MMAEPKWTLGSDGIYHEGRLCSMMFLVAELNRKERIEMAAKIMRSWDHPGHPGKAEQAKRGLYAALAGGEE